MQKVQIPSKYQGLKSKSGQIVRNSKSQLIIHAMGEFIDYSDNKDYFAPDWLDFMGYAAHYFVTPSGVVIESLDENLCGAHAKGFNVGSIGIEFLVKGVHTYPTFIEAIKTDWATKEQFDAGVELCQELMYDWPGLENMQRHSDIDPKRKQDPGSGFDWDKFKENVYC